jgi:hypothetical protein
MEMMYNGVHLDLIELQRVERRTITTPDETTVLYTEWDIQATGVLHPSVSHQAVATSIGGTSVTYANPSQNVLTRVSPAPTATGGNPNFPSITTPGTEGPLATDRELLPRLLVPRKTLVIWAYGGVGDTQQVWLQSPRPGLNQDARGGPIVQAIPVTSIQGQGVSMGVQLSIKTWVPPCPYGSDRLILAHRWQTTLEHDDDFFLTRRITGEMHFHAGVKEKFDIRPDWVYHQMFHPIPLGFRRTLGPVSRSPDGLVVRYSYIDTDQRVVFDPTNSGATRVEIVEHSGMVAPMQGVEDLMKRAGVGVADVGGMAVFGQWWPFVKLAKRAVGL